MNFAFALSMVEHNALLFSTVDGRQPLHFIMSIRRALGEMDINYGKTECFLNIKVGLLEWIMTSGGVHLKIHSIHNTLILPDGINMT